jgi:hypothetical protein
MAHVATHTARRKNKKSKSIVTSFFNEQLIMNNEQLAAARHSWSADYAVAPVTGSKSA